MESEELLLKRVLLLAVLNRGENSIESVLAELDEVGAMSLKESKRVLKELKNSDLIQINHVSEALNYRVLDQKIFR